MSTREDLKMQLAKVDAEIAGIQGGLSKAKTVRGSILDRLFEIETGFLIGSDALYSARHRQQQNLRAKILRRSSDGVGGRWGCTVRLYKKDGTLGQNEARVFSVEKELRQLED